MTTARTARTPARLDLFRNAHVAAQILDALSGLIVVLDTAGRIVYFNKGCQKLTGFQATEVLGHLVWNVLVPPENRETVASIFADVAKGQTDAHPRHHWLTKSGGLVLIEWSNFTVSGKNAEVRYIVGTGIDVTQEEWLHETLHEAEGRFQALLDTVPGAVVVINDLGIILFFSRGAEELFGYRSEDMIGTNVTMLMPELDRSEHNGHLERYSATGKPHIIGLKRELNGRRKDGSLFPIELTVAEYEDGRRNFVGHIQDISERREAEKQIQGIQVRLRQGTRLSALDQMGSVLAHELNQPLTALSNYVEALRRMVHREPGGPSQQLEKVADLALEQARRASDTIANLRALFSGNMPSLSPEKIGAVVEEALALLLASHKDGTGSNLKVTRHIDDSLPPVPMIRTQILEVLVNVLQNSYEALADEKEGHIEIRCERRGDLAVEVSVSDTGRGLDPAIADRIFEPFTTTKPSGTGLGLAVSRSIIEAHGGRLWATSDETGTTLRFTLPVIR
ncbi:MAG: PAS domain S-box protein [Alphaproteobacteria bacterium]